MCVSTTYFLCGREGTYPMGPVKAWSAGLTVHPRRVHGTVRADSAPLALTSHVHTHLGVRYRLVIITLL